MTALIKFVLGQISVVTKRDEFTDYLTHIWIPFRKKIEADGSVTTPEQELKKMDEHLDGILDLAKAQHEHMTDYFLNVPSQKFPVPKITKQTKSHSLNFNVLSSVIDSSGEEV